MILRPYQKLGEDEVHDAFAAGARSVLYVLPTAGGKTVLFADIVRRAAAHGTRSCILVHRDQLLVQAAAKVREFGLAYSIIAPGHRFYGDRVVIASKDTLVRRLDRHHFDLLVIDEAHRATAPSYRKIMDAYPNVHILGVTATPQRTNGEGLDSVFQAMVLGPGIRDLIDHGHLAEPVTYGAIRKIDLSSVKTVAGDYDQGALADIMDRPRVTGDAIAEYKRLCPGEPAMAFCVSVKHAEDVAAQFREAGVRANHVSGAMASHEVRDRIASLADGRCQVLASCDIASEGVDVPAVRAAILLRPTKSLIVYLQQAGRALRPAPGKPNALILDHAGSFVRFGMVDDPRDWTLSGRKRRKGEATEAAVPIRQCPMCYRAHRPAPICPNCGHQYIVEAREPDAVAGDLERIDPGALRRARAKRISTARTYGELKEVAQQFGYSSQWAWRLFLERGGDPRRAA